MTLPVPAPRTLFRGLLAGVAVALASCRTPSTKLDLSPDAIATPPHRMSRTEYPFDASGRYVDAWAAAGATRYGRFVNTDRTEDDRRDTAEPERRPLPPPREPTSTPPPPPPAERPESPGSRPPARPRTEPASRAGTSRNASPETRTTPAAKPPVRPRTTAKATSKTTAKPASKPTPKTTSKPPAKKTAKVQPAKPTTHTVRRGDSLSALSQRYGVSVLELKKANRLSSDRIIDGRKLVIPRK